MAQSIVCPLYDPEIETIEEFLERFAMVVEGDGKKKDKTVAVQLVRALPVQIISGLQRRLSPQKLSDTSLDQLKENLLQAHGVHKSIVGASVKFFMYRQQQSQSIEDFSKELRFLASSCDFENITADRLLRDVFIAGLSSSHVLSTVLQEAEDLSFSEAVEKAKFVQQVKDDTRYIQDTHCSTLSSNVYKTAFDTTSTSNVVREVEQSVHKLQSQIVKKPPPGYVCIRCGAANLHFVDQCYAQKLKCRNCNKVGHIGRVCRSKMFSRNVSTSVAPRGRSFQTAQATNNVVLHKSGDVTGGEQQINYSGATTSSHHTTDDYDDTSCNIGNISYVSQYSNTNMSNNDPENFLF